MFLGALLELGVPKKVMEQAVRTTGMEGWELTSSRTRKGVISARRVKVKVTGKQPPRNYMEIKKLIRASGLPGGVRDRALDIFGKLAAAEARIHGGRVDKVHFHEVGAVDSIVDIIGAAAGLDYLGVEEAASSPVPLGKGVISCAHGALPLPAPAALELLRGLESYGVDIVGETCTPTGAAILKSTSRACGLMPSMTIKKVGYGAGAADWPARPNVLRLVLGKRRPQIEGDRVICLEANVDDMTPQDFEPLMERLFDAGALDVGMINIQMKKNRPGVMIRALAPPGQSGRVMDALLIHSSSLGVRWYPASRRILSRQEVSIKTAIGKIGAKKSVLPDGSVRLTPEYEDLKTAAQKAGISLEEARKAFWRAADGRK